jgi:23S rRNA pseudouridine2605 synthase
MKKRTSRRRHQVSLARALSKLGFCSRTQAIPLIHRGRVSVNGSVVLNPHRWVNLHDDKITFDGKTLPPKKQFRFVMVNKPKGVVTTRSDERGRSTVMDLLGEEGKGLFPVGRLDKDSTGLLLLTNDHRLGECLTNPASHIPKTYLVSVNHPLKPEDIEKLRSGVVIELNGGTYRTRSANVRSLDRTTVEITISEGKNRQLRRMFDTLGYEVIALHRVALDGLQLGALKEGEFRALKAEEIQRLNIACLKQQHSHKHYFSDARNR